MTDASGRVHLDDVIITGELDRRPPRTPDRQVESEALAALADELADRPYNFMQKLADTLVEIGVGDSAGVSLREEADGAERFRWVGLAGRWGQFKGRVMPFDASPCGVVVERDATLLFEHPERFFPAAAVDPLIHEILLVPFHAEGRPVGTLWVNAHDEARKFDAEDVRLLRNLARFASAGHQMNEALGGARAKERASRQALEADLAGTRRLYDLHARLAAETDLKAALDEILAAACEFTATDRGCVQLFRDDGQRLEISAERGHGPDSPFIRRFLHEGSMPGWDAARAQRRRLVIEDVATFAPLLNTPDREVALAEGIHAIQSTPMISRKGEMLGVLSTQFREPRRPTDEQLRLVDLLAWSAADFVERRCVTAELLVSEAHFRTFAESFEDVFYITDLERGALAYLSPSYDRVWGRPAAELMADLSTFLDTVHPEDRPAFRAGQAAQLRGEPVRTEYRIMRPDGTVRWVFDRSFPIAGAAGKRSGGIASDITERKLAEARHRETEALLRGFGEASSDIVWIRHAETLQWEYLSPAFEAIYGVAVKDALSGDTFLNWAESIVEEDRELAMANIGRVRAGERVSFEYRVRRPDGELRWLRDTDFPMRGSSGEVERIGGVGQDVTERKKIEIALRDRERRLESIIETARDYAILTLDAEGRVNGWWTGAKAAFGYDAGEVVGRDSAILWLEEDRAGGEPEKERVAARERGSVADVRWHLRKDGTPVFIEGVTTPLLDPDGRVTSYLKVGRDMTERHAADQRRDVLVAELQHRTRNLIAVVSSIAQQTMAATTPTEAFREEFTHRLEALSRVQGLLSRSEEEPVTIEGLIRMELDALGVRDGASGHVVLDGPAVRLRNSLVQTLALGLHELATNARKHGALSRDVGRLHVTWRVRDMDGEGPRLALEWIETGAEAPIDTAPERRGYGLELIERALPYALGAKTRYELRPEGVRCTIDLPLEKERRRRRR